MYKLLILVALTCMVYADVPVKVVKKAPVVHPGYGYGYGYDVAANKVREAVVNKHNAVRQLHVNAAARAYGASDGTASLGYGVPGTPLGVTGYGYNYGYAHPGYGYAYGGYAHPGYGYGPLVY